MDDNEINDGLTPEEIEALKESDGGTTVTMGDSLDVAATGETDVNQGATAGAEGGQGGDDNSEADAAVAAEAAAAAATPAGDGEGATAAADGNPAGDGADAAASDTASAFDAPEPILVAEMPENADQRLKDIEAAKAKADEAMENGDITTREWREQTGKLDKEQRELERAVDKANTAIEMHQQQVLNQWKGQVAEYTTKLHPEYNPEKNALRYGALDQMVRKVGSDPANANLSARAILDKAHALVEKELGPVAKPTTTKQGQPPTKEQIDAANKKKADELNAAGRPLKAGKAKAPTTLKDVPAASGEDVSGDAGKYAALDRLQASDPERHENELMKLSASERDAYLAYSGQ